MNLIRFCTGLVLLSSFLLPGCAPEPPGEEAAPAPAEEKALLVYTVNYPLQYFAERIGGDQVHPVFPVPSGEDPAFWSPSPEEVAAFQSADLVLLNGAGYAGWVERVTLPPSKLVDTSEAFRDRYIGMEESVTHSHGLGGEHSHGETAFTTWLDLSLALEQALAVRYALTIARPAKEAWFLERFGELERDLRDLDQRLRAVTAGRAGVPLLGSHPVYQYLARGYDLNIESVHFEPDAFPDAGAWADLAEILERHPAEWMLWEGEPLEKTAARLREMGVESAVFDPCGNRPDTGDFLFVMKGNVADLETVFSGE